MSLEKDPILYKKSNREFLFLRNCLVVGDMPPITFVSPELQFKAMFKNMLYYVNTTHMMTSPLTSKALKNHLSDYAHSQDMRHFKHKVPELIDGYYAMRTPPKMSYKWYDADFMNTLDPHYHSNPVLPKPDVIMFFNCGSVDNTPGSPYAELLKHAILSHTPVLQTDGNHQLITTSITTTIASTNARNQVCEDAAKLSAQLKIITEERDRYKSLCEGYDILTADASNG